MPIEVAIWRIDDGPQPLPFSTMESEAKLEQLLVEDISVLQSGLMVIGRQVPTAHGKFIDILAMDQDGNLAVIELKRHRTPREVVAQLLDYASWAQNLSYQQIVDIYSERNAGREFEQGFADAFDASPPDKVNEQLQLLVVAAELDPASERIITYLADNFGVPINAVFFRYFKDGSKEYPTRSWLIDPQEAEAKASTSVARKGREGWNGQDFYVSFGDESSRDWEDARRYGFISAGGGRWYTRTLNSLFIGARVFVCMPKRGYLGVGKVIGSPTPVKDFNVELDGQTLPILAAPLKARNMDHDADDPELSEHLVRIEWINTLAMDQAYWENGMYANQNTVTRLRNQFTLERLIRHFELDID